MAQGERWPSGWWFWGLPLAANLYLVPFILVLRMPWYVWGMGGPMQTLVGWVTLPAGLFETKIAYPLSQALHVGYGAVARAFLFVGLWELSVVLVGLTVYGGALLIYLIMPEPGREGAYGPPASGEGPSNG